MAIVDNDAAETAVVRDYLGRLHAAGWGLAPARRDELVAEVGEHISEARRAEREAGHHGEAVMRNILERLGPPEEIVRAESEGQPYDVAGGGPSGPAPFGDTSPGYAPFGQPAYPGEPATAYVPASIWGPVEIIAVLLLSLGSFVLPVVGPIVGVVLVWVSTQWTRPQKFLGSALGLLPVLWLPLALFIRL